MYVYMNPEVTEEHLLQWEFQNIFSFKPKNIAMPNTIKLTTYKKMTVKIIFLFYVLYFLHWTCTPYFVKLEK